MGQPLPLAISKNEKVYVLQGLDKLLQDVHRQQASVVTVALPGENSLQLLTQYYERRRLDLDTLITKYKNAFS